MRIFVLFRASKMLSVHWFSQGMTRPHIEDTKLLNSKSIKSNMMKKYILNYIEVSKFFTAF